MEEEIKNVVVECFNDLDILLIDRKIFDTNIEVTVEKMMIDYYGGVRLFNLSEKIKLDKNILFRLSEDESEVEKKCGNKRFVGYYFCYLTTMSLKIKPSNKIRPQTIENKLLECLDRVVYMLNTYYIFSKQIYGITVRLEKNTRYIFKVYSVEPELITIKSTGNRTPVNIFSVF
jgi:hypothetical protein